MADNVIWTGWIAGVSLGIYALVQYWISDRQLGCSLAYGNFSRYIPGSRYFRTGDFSSTNNWRLWFFIGIPLGGFIASLTSPDVTIGINLSMGEFYERILPEPIWAKAVYLLIGGIIMSYGARLAGGCTSGHVIAGCSLRNPVSFLAAALFFVSGLAAVQFMFYMFAE